MKAIPIPALCDSETVSVGTIGNRAILSGVKMTQLHYLPPGKCFLLLDSSAFMNGVDEIGCDIF